MKIKLDENVPLRVGDDLNAANVAEVMLRLAEAVELVSLEGCITIVEDDRVRVRRPSPSGP